MERHVILDPAEQYVTLNAAAHYVILNAAKHFIILRTMKHYVILSAAKNLDSSVASSLRMTKNNHKLTATNYHPASGM